ncbi:MAG: hypothetical protein QM656_09165 [Paracoccaceae bacterium]
MADPEEQRDGESREDRRRRRKARKTALPVLPPVGRLDAAALLGDIDAWNLRIDGDWLRFDARLGDHPRGYMCALSGGDIIADAPGPLLAVLGIGGPRAAGFNAGPSPFAQNVLAPADHIGAIGCEGTALAARTPGLQRIPHRPREALCAETLLGWRALARRGLPLILTRVETEAAASVAALGEGIAFANFQIALDNLCDAAASLGRRAQVLAVTLAHGVEDLGTDPAAIAAGFRRLMARIEGAMTARGLVPPTFLATAETGTARIASHPAVRAFHDLALHPGPHRLILPAPAYAFAQDRNGRPTEDGRLDMARMDAHALTALEGGGDWFCPTALLAEADGARIRVTFRAMEPLVIDPDPPLPAGPSAGFRLNDPGVAILSAELAADDPRSVILTCDRPPASGAELCLACDLPTTDDRPPNRSALRDLWTAPGATGPLHRWALPAALPIRPGAA